MKNKKNQLIGGKKTINLKNKRIIFIFIFINYNLFVFIIYMDESIEKILYKIGMDVAMDYQNELRSLGSVATGTLANTVDFNVEVNGGTYKIYLLLEDYWKYVEEGREPGKFPNVGKLMEWIKVVNILPRPLPDGSLPTQELLVYMIRNRIKTKGIEAKPALKNALNKNQDMLTKAKAAIGNGLNKEIKKMLQELNK